MTEDSSDIIASGHFENNRAPIGANFKVINISVRISWLKLSDPKHKHTTIGPVSFT